MKAILIDSKLKTVTEVEMTEPTLKFMQNAVGGYIEKAYQIDPKNELYVDEEGLLKKYDTFFFYRGAHAPFAGNGIIVSGDDETGDTLGTTLSADHVRKQICWMNSLEALSLARAYGV